MITVEPRVYLRGTDGRWYTPMGGLPTGVKWTGERKTRWVFCDSSGPVYFGRGWDTEAEAKAALAACEEERNR